MLTLIKNAKVFSPKELGLCDLLIANGRIAQISKKIDINSSSITIEKVNADGRLLIPGFVDTLVHITGGGGEGGFNTRTPELSLRDAVRGGVTSLIGALGTDASTRSLSELYGKAKALNEDGLSCFMYTGSYEIPVKTITGQVRNDLIFIEPVIGVGEIAISDHRGSQATTQELARIAADARVGGMIAGKSGIVMIHVGSTPQYLEPLHRTSQECDVSLSQFYPTHINRSKELLDAGIAFAKAGGTIDLTASTTEHILAMGEMRASTALNSALEAGVPADKITISSDAQGSLPHFNQYGQLDGLDVGSICSVHLEWTKAIKDLHIPLSIALATCTANPAKITGLASKGEIAVGKDADFNLLDPDSLAIDSVMSQGQWMMKNKTLLCKTTFDH